MNLDIDQLTLEELYALNTRVVDRIKRLLDTQTQLDMMAFNLGARVSFDSQYGRQTGVVTKLNRKTVVVLGDDGRKWKVSPAILSPIRNVADIQPAAVSQKRIPKS